MMSKHIKISLTSKVYYFIDLTVFQIQYGDIKIIYSTNTYVWAIKYGRKINGGHIWKISYGVHILWSISYGSYGPERCFQHLKKLVSTKCFEKIFLMKSLLKVMDKSRIKKIIIYNTLALIAGCIFRAVSITRAIRT